MSDTFKCSACGGTFEKARSDEEAEAEMHETFGDLPKDDQSVVCDQCWEIIQKRAKAAGLWPPPKE